MPRNTEHGSSGLSLDHVDAVEGVRSRRKALITHVLANQVLFPFEKTVGAFPYIAHEASSETATTAIVGEYEEAWKRGQHDGDAIAEALHFPSSG